MISSLYEDEDANADNEILASILEALYTRFDGKLNIQDESLR